MATQVTQAPIVAPPPPSAQDAEPTPYTPQPIGHGKTWQSFERMGLPLSNFLNRNGSESFWPTSLDEESEKAGRILRSFCKDGIVPPEPLVNEKQTPSHSPNRKSESDPLLPFTETNRPPLPPRPASSALLRIPPKVIHNAVGLAIFTLIRGGALGASYSTGSGVLIARDANQQWSSPSGIIVNTLGLGMMAGLDVYDCVLVINTREALEGFMNARISLGGDIGITAGPWGAGRGVDWGLSGKKSKEQKSKGSAAVWSYIKSRGLYAGIQLDGTVVTIRHDENARFYGERVDVNDIVVGHVRRWTGLQEVLNEVEKLGSTEGVDFTTRGREKKEKPLTRAPVLLEFIDRRGQTKGADGVWYKTGDARLNDQERVIEREPSIKSTKGSIKGANEDLYTDEKSEKQRDSSDSKDREAGAWEKRDTFA